LLLLEYFYFCLYLQATKKGRIYGKGAPFKGAPQMGGGQFPQTAPPRSATGVNALTFGKTYALGFRLVYNYMIVQCK